MNEEIKTVKIEVSKVWGQMWHRLAVVVPLKVLAWLDGEKTKAKKQHPLTILIVCLILLLSVASVTNLYTRANSHHAGISAYATGAGFAFLVPLSIFFAVYMPLGKFGKVGAWLISITFALTSAAIQYNIYAPADKSVNLEAIAFGAGIPVAECLLAVLEGILINYLARQEKAIKDAEADKEKAIIDAIRAAELVEQNRIEAQRIKAEQERIADQERIEAQRRADTLAHKEQERQQALFDFEMEAKRLELAAKLEAERLLLQAKLDAKSQRKSDSEANKKSDSKNTESPKTEVDFESKVIDYYRVNPLASQRKAATDLVLSQAKVNRLLADLESRKVIHRNGNGVEILS